MQTLLEFFDTGRHDGGSFDSGIQFALERVLVDPDFLLRVHRDSRADHACRPRGPLTSAIWKWPRACRSSCGAASPTIACWPWPSADELTKPAILEKEVRRMLADPRATDALVDDFAAQWLNLRRVEEVVVDPIRYPNYDESLLQAFKRETEMFVASTLREDRSVADLLNANYTFVNERLARHYGIPGIYGSRFRRVTLPNHDQRGGLLAQGALLATTSYPDRTSPVLRGKWLLNNIFGLPVPPPPPGVDTNLEEPSPAPCRASMRERLAQHRKNPSCNSCHSVIDPLGFALENFDVIGGWRTDDESGKPVDASGTTVSGAKVEGLSGLRTLLLEQPEQFPRTVTEKLLSYALGRRLEYYDRPAVRKIVRDAAAQQYRWSSIILGIVRESHVFDAGITIMEKSAMTFLTAKSLPRRTVLRGLGASGRAAAAGCHDSRILQAGAGRLEAGASIPGVLCAERHGHGVLVAEGRRERIRTLSHSGAAGAVSKPNAGALGHQGELELHPRGRLRVVSYGHDARRTQRSGNRRRRLDGSDTRETLRPGNAGGIARTRNGSAGQRRRVHRQSELRLHPHAFVAEPHSAAADGVEPASRVREVVRRQRQHGAGGARSEIAAAQEHSGLRNPQVEPSSRRISGPGDQVKVEEYTEAIRDVERRIQKAEEQSSVALPAMEQPQGAPPVFEDHLALMLDLQVLAFRSDLTRVISFMIGKEQSARPYPQIGVPEAHHPLSHHNNVPELIAQMSKINRYHTQLFSQYLAKLRATPDGDGSLLDHMTILYGSGISNSTRHSGDNLPLLLVGGGAGRLKGGRHLMYRDKPPMANLLVTLMDKLDVPVERLGGSTGKLPLDTLPEL